jgi:uncharacterized protein
MAEYLSPAVYIEEPSSGIRPLQGVGTSTAAFLGLAQKGPIGVAVPITNFSQFLKTFGTYIDGAFLAFAVKSFFGEGGTSCYVVRTCHYAGGPKVPTAASSAMNFQNSGGGPINVLGITALSAGIWGDNISVSLRDAVPAGERFVLEIKYNGNVVEIHDALTLDAASPDYAVSRINAISEYVKAADLVPAASVLTALQRKPAATAAPVFLAGGSDGTSGLIAADFAGEANLGNGLIAFDAVDDINIVGIPDALDRNVHLRGIAYCELRKDCVYLIDSQATIGNADDVVNYKLAQGLYSGNAFNSKYAALYAPWVMVTDPRNGKKIKIPPCGPVAGRFAAVDVNRGVHKPPAGMEDGRFLTVLDTDRDFSDADQAKLNPQGINVIRKFTGAGTVIWGARTVSKDPEWTYLNVRRLFLFLEGTIENSTKWTVFEPNDIRLWKSLETNIASFLRTQWAIGALVGLKEEEAFYVKCDAETNPPESIDLGRVITEIGVAPVKPAEFVIFRFSQMAAKP